MESKDIEEEKIRTKFFKGGCSCMAFSKPRERINWQLQPTQASTKFCIKLKNALKLSTEVI